MQYYLVGFIMYNSSMDRVVPGLIYNSSNAKHCSDRVRESKQSLRVEASCTYLLRTTQVVLTANITVLLRSVIMIYMIYTIFPQKEC